MRAEELDSTATGAELRERLQHVYWIGGGSGAGKSTVARRLADRFGLHVYATDEVMGDHARRSSPGDAPFLASFMSMNMDERWLNRSPLDMLHTFHWFRGEGFDLIVEDLLRIPAETGVIAEGFRLLPRLIAPLAAPGHAVWLLPTPAFRRATFDSRGTTWDIPNQTTNPKRALQNLLERDQMFTDHLSAEAKRLGLPTIEIDSGTSEDELVEKVATAIDFTTLDSMRPCGHREPS
jgi:2-phosphoglycerate kinase